MDDYEIISLLDIDVSPEGMATIGRGIQEVAAGLCVEPRELAQAMRGEVRYNQKLGNICFVIDATGLGLDATMYVEIPAAHWRFKREAHLGPAQAATVH